MGWIEILAASNPFICAMIIFSILGLVFGMIQTIVKKDDAVGFVVAILAILWALVGIGYYIGG